MRPSGIISEFDDALESILEKIIDNLEKDANHLNPLAEDAITAYLAVAINAIPGLRVLQQAHSNGHVDITIEVENTPPIRRRLGEAKIYDGPEYHEKGLIKLKVHMDTNMPCAQTGKSQDHRIRWAFVTHHQHSSGELLRVLHLSCNLHRS